MLRYGLAESAPAGYAVPKELEAKLSCLRPWQFLVIEAIGRRVLDPEQADVGLFADTYCVGLAGAGLEDRRGCSPTSSTWRRSDRASARASLARCALTESRASALEQSPVGLLRGGFQAVKALAMMALYKTDESFAALGYGGPTVRWSNR